MSVQLPLQFEIECLADGVPVPGVLTLVSLRVSRKNPYTAIVGPTDHSGRIVVNRSELEHEAEEIASERRNRNSSIVADPLCHGFHCLPERSPGLDRVRISHGIMSSVRIRKHIDSDTLTLPELRPFIGRTVEIVIEEPPIQRWFPALKLFQEPP